MNEYDISCPITGFMTRIPHEDGELNEAMLKAFDSADFGVLTDVDMTNELWQVRGYYAFTVLAHSEDEALSKAQEVFDKLWDDGEVDCGDLHDIDRDTFENGEEYRCSGERRCEKELE